MLLLFVCVLCAGWDRLEQSPTSHLLPFGENGQAGYLDIRTGEWAIKPAFNEVQGFSEGLAPVQVAGAWGYIDEKGAFLIQPTFLKAGPFHEGIALVSPDQERTIYINKAGKAIASTERSEWIADRQFVFSDGRGLISAKGKLGYIDETGKTVIEPKYSQAKRFSEGIAPVAAEGAWQLIDVTGKVRGSSEAGAWGLSDTRTGEFSEGLSVAMSTKPPGNLGYVNSNGTTAIEFQFMEAGRFAEGLAEVRAVEYVRTNTYRAGPVGYINRMGQYVIPPRFEGGHEFSEGLATVALDGNWGYIDKSGTMIIPPRFAQAGPFSRGLALVFVDDQPKSTNIFERARRELKLACINKQGAFVWGPKTGQDRRDQSERMLEAWVTASVAGLRRGDQATKDKVEAEMKKLPRSAIPLLKEYEGTVDPEFRARIQQLLAYLSGESKATEERLISVLQKWEISEYGMKANTHGGYDVMLYPHPVKDISPLKGLPIKSLDLRSTGVKDLSPLQGMPVERLVIDGSCDLTGIRGLPIKELHLYDGKNDLSAVEGLRLEKLVISGCLITNLTPLHGMPLKDLILQNVPVTSLEPLRGMPLTDVSLLGLPLADPTPLQGMMLTNLLLSNCRRVTDLSFVKGMPLESASFDPRFVTNGLEVLRQLSQLKRINGKPAEQFLRRQDVLEDLKTRMRAAGITYDRAEVDDGGLCSVQLTSGTAIDLSALKGSPIKSLSLGRTRVEDLSALEGLPLQSLSLPSQRITNGIDIIRHMAGIKDINGLAPQRFWTEYDSVTKEQEWRGTLDARNVKYADFRVTEDGKVILNLNGKGVTDLSGLAGVPVNELFMAAVKATDLSPLKGMPLTEFWAEDSLVSDLSALEGMRITSLNLRGSRVKDLSPLRGMPLRLLYLMDTAVEDLSPLAGMPLYELAISNTKVTDLSPLKGMRLGQLAMSNVPVTDLSPLEGMKLLGLYISGTKITDVSPLRQVEVWTLGFTPENIAKGMNDLRQLKSLRKVVLGRPGARSIEVPVAEFWRRYDAGEFRAGAH